MSVRLLTTKLIKHGRYFLQSFWRRDIHFNILEQNPNKSRFRLTTSAAGTTRVGTNPTSIGKNALSAGSSQAARSVPSNGIFRFGQHARKLFIDNILNRVTTTYSEELRHQATKKLFYGDSAPFFALIGVSLASGAGVLTKEDELEGVCWEIREAVGRLQHAWTYDEVSDAMEQNFNIDKLNIGPAIAKGCAAVVYAASMKSDTDLSSSTGSGNTDEEDKFVMPKLNAESPLLQQNLHAELISPIQSLSRFVHNFGGSVDNLNIYNQSLAAATVPGNLIASQWANKIEQQPIHNDSDSLTAAKNGMQGIQKMDSSLPSISRYPLALKMMFNYDIQSNALSILRAMYKETVPARQRHVRQTNEDWEQLITDQTLTLPAHPNIVCMYGFFCDEVRSFPDGHILYPIAQPQRINPLGYGRNMSLFLLMKRYDYSLRALLDSHELSARTKLILLAQLLEAVAHINRYGIAHRDLKSDNILIETGIDDSPPVLVLSDFGCCLANKVHGLQIPYTSLDIDKGGNVALMAPEIINKQPGPFAVLDYAKADLWACGAIAYEIFGLRNPFYSSTGGLAAINGQSTFSLRNSDYKIDELPPLTEDCPELVQQLVFNILNPKPSKRVSPDVAANVMQLFLWAPSNWLKSGGLPNSSEILQWLLSLTTKVMCEGRTFSASAQYNSLNYNTQGRRTYVEYLLISSFLARARLRRIRGALNWIQNVI